MLRLAQRVQRRFAFYVGRPWNVMQHVFTAFKVWHKPNISLWIFDQSRSDPQCFVTRYIIHILCASFSIWTAKFLYFFVCNRV